MEWRQKLDIDILAGLYDNGWKMKQYCSILKNFKRLDSIKIVCIFLIFMHMKLIHVCTKVVRDR